MKFLLPLSLSVSLLPSVFAADANDWRGRSIYQQVFPLLSFSQAEYSSRSPTESSSTDMHSLKGLIQPNVIQVTKLGVAELGIPSGRTWITFRMLALQQVSVATFRTLTPSLFGLLLLVWISPVSQNYEGGRTPYGDPYHGYWIADHSQLNEHFGTADDLKALSDELHRRGM